ncbi:MAG: 7-cyano-7-deazaguanine synthase [Pirellulales bacterium]
MLQAKRIQNGQPSELVALLVSGGLDSCILLAHLLASGRTVQPIYIRTGVAWELEELTAVRSFSSAVQSPRLREHITLELPLDDLYANHWSINGRGAPGADSADEAVYLPGRNPLLLVKAAVWCQMHGVEQLALAPLASNPFADATEEFFAAFERAIGLAGSTPLRIVRPFAGMTKREVVQLGRCYPLNDTFSCIAPVDGLHCGRCNKCGERKSAFDLVDLADPTRYASELRSTPHQRVYL